MVREMVGFLLSLLVFLAGCSPTAEQASPVAGGDLLIQIREIPDPATSRPPFKINGVVVAPGAEGGTGTFRIEEIIQSITAASAATADRRLEGLRPGVWEFTASGNNWATQCRSDIQPGVTNHVTFVFGEESCMVSQSKRDPNL